MKPIILWELRQRKSYLFWWTVGTVGIIVLLLSIYPSIHHQAGQLNKVLNQLPAALRDLKTGGSQVDIATPVGYLNSQLFYLTLPFMQIIMAIGLGSTLLAREEQNHTLELLLARPISRGKVLLAKALSGLLLVLIVSVPAMLAVIVMARLVAMPIATSYLLLTSLYTMLFAMSFGAIAFCLCALSSLSRRSSTAIAVVLSFGGYLFASLSGLSHYIEAPARFLPYHYFNPAQLLVGHIAAGINIYLILIAVISGLVSWLGFRRRDIS